MASRTIQVPDIAWETPLFEQSKKWLADNGIDPYRVPLESEIVIDDDTITYESTVLNDKGGAVFTPDGERVLRETVTVPKHSSPETYGL
jgi:hypothetical protein